MNDHLPTLNEHNSMSDEERRIERERKAFSDIEPSAIPPARDDSEQAAERAS